MTLKLAKFCDDPNKISTKSSYPKKIFIFLKTPKNIEIQNFEPQKKGRAYVCVKISDNSPWGSIWYFCLVISALFGKKLAPFSVT